MQRARRASAAPPRAFVPAVIRAAITHGIKERSHAADKRSMDLSSITSMLSSGAAYANAGQASLIVLKKTLDASEAQASALVQLMEQVPAPQICSEHQIDVYA
jgi:hypothetical protein